MPESTELSEMTRFNSAMQLVKAVELTASPSSLLFADSGPGGIFNSTVSATMNPRPFALPFCAGSQQGDASNSEPDVLSLSFFNQPFCGFLDQIPYTAKQAILLTMPSSFSAIRDLI